MGMVARREFLEGREFHVGTGKLPVESHQPQWEEWTNEYPGLQLRQCKHPDCDLDDWRKVITPA